MPDRSGLTAIDEQMTRADQMPAEKRKAAERLLRDDAQLKRQRREDDRDVVDALVIRDEYVRLARLHPLEPLDAHVHACRRKDQPRPRPRAPVRRVPFAVDERGEDRERAEDDGVDRNGGNEEEDRSPPVERRNLLNCVCLARRPPSRVDQASAARWHR